MQILIDTLSSLGVIDYSSCVEFGKNATIVRELNKPTVCMVSLLTGPFGFPTPAILAGISILDSTGLVLFTGYVSESPVPHQIGQACDEPVATVLLVATSDEILMDSDQVSNDMTLLGQSAKLSWEALTRLSLNQLQTAVYDQTRISSRFLVKAGSRWSERAANLAAQTNSAYRCISGTTNVTPIGHSVYAVAADDPGLNFEYTTINDLRWLARDVTVCGREEPTAYVTEVFVGDGSTSSFVLSQQPFHPASAQKISLLDLFQGTSLNDRLWHVSDPGAHIALTQSGLTCDGGTGRDGEAVVSTVQQIELGGTITVEATGVSILPGSSGALLGLYTGDILLAHCLAGFYVSSTSQSVELTAEVSSVAVGSAYPIQTGHLYTLRLRVYSPEMERLRQDYAMLTSNGSIVVGGDTVLSAGQVLLEVEDTTSGIAGTPTVLFTGQVSELPAACTLGLINSGNLNCSIKTIRCGQTEAMLVTLGSTATTQAPLLLASSVEGGSCHLTATGTLQFYPASIPASGQLVVTSYRLAGISVARRSLPLPSGETNLPLTLSWIGSVTDPTAWSSNDCDNAATAILEAVADGAPALKGSYVSALKGSDILPGDTLSIGPRDDGSALNVVVQKAVITMLSNFPEATSTRIDFATSPIGGTSFRLSSAIPANVSLPQGPTNIREALNNLSGLSLADVSAVSLDLLTGSTPPLNGGFEVRRRDHTFGPGMDSDLVLRTAATTISIPRSSSVEQFYIRMYDSSQPPKYSQFSAAIFLNVPLGS